jgi:site-specific DNA-methyltransferase (adenine-specific)
VTHKILVGNNLEILPTLPDNSVDSIVTDPPYGLSDNKFVAETITRWVNGERDFVPDGKGFMGKSWDAFVPPPALWDQCLRVLKPGGHLLAFFGSRTQDIGGLAIRMAGFEIRDSIGWIYGSGFPKSMDVSKAIDKAAGAVRKETGLPNGNNSCLGGSNCNCETNGISFSQTRHPANTEPATTEAEQWQGWGTALKPALEPIIVARKPLIGTVAENVLTYGTGGLNIDSSRIGTETVGWQGAGRNVSATTGASQGGEQGGYNYGDGKARPVQGRWPANIVLDPYTAELLDEQSGKTQSKAANRGLQVSGQAGGLAGANPNYKEGTDSMRGHNDSGGASRFFYVAKASKRDRNEGLEGMPLRKSDQRSDKAAGIWVDMEAPKQNFHPTVKPTALMEYLIKLVTPPRGTVLDPFTGSGSTGKAAVLNGFDFIGIEMTEDYVPIIEGRLKHAEKVFAEQGDEETEKLF